MPKEYALIRLIVSGLPHDTTESDIRDLFEEIGPVLKVEIQADHPTNALEQTAYVDVATEGQATDAIRHFRNRTLRGHQLVIERA
jgi:RNA recognition motif-containing protein